MPRRPRCAWKRRPEADKRGDTGLGGGQVEGFAQPRHEPFRRQFRPLPYGDDRDGRRREEDVARHACDGNGSHDQAAVGRGGAENGARHLRRRAKRRRNGPVEIRLILRQGRAKASFLEHERAIMEQGVGERVHAGHTAAKIQLEDRVSAFGQNIRRAAPLRVEHRARYGRGHAQLRQCPLQMGDLDRRIMLVADPALQAQIELPVLPRAVDTGAGVPAHVA